MKRGFKAAARRLALEVRREVGLHRFARFDPYALADEYGIPVYEVGDLGKEDQAREAADHYTASNPGAFSAALVPVGSGMFILDNDGHSMVRRRNSVSHEMSHVVLEHEFDTALLMAEGCRSVDEDKEEEATWLAGELLIPYAAAGQAARASLTDDEVAERYDVSPQLTGMRMNYSGARKVVARKRAYAAAHQ